jgi:hypothetical protein
MVLWCHACAIADRAFFVPGRFLPQQTLPLKRRSPLPSPFSCVLLSRCPSACLATLRVDFFKVLMMQYLIYRNGYFRSLTRSVGVAEGSRTTWVFLPGFLVDCSTPLHEVVRCQSSQASQSIHYPRNSECYPKGWRLLYLVASVWMS